ncbi:hypothetical protein B0H14DRAFT_3142007, partial [Mycena olivaceomarginata]
MPLAFHALDVEYYFPPLPVDFPALTVPIFNNTPFIESITPECNKWDVGHTEMLFNKTDADAPVVGPVKTDEVLLERCRFCRSGLKVGSELAGTRRLMGSRSKMVALPGYTSSYDIHDPQSKRPKWIRAPSNQSTPNSGSDVPWFRAMLFNQAETVTYTLGAWGVLCAQFGHYMSLNKRDSIWMKLFVAGLALLTTLKTLESLAIMWIQNVTMFGDREAGSNIWHKHWVWEVTIPLEAATAFYVQLFFCRRLWAISGNTYLVIVCITLFLFGLISGVVTTFYLFTNTLKPTARWGGGHLVLVLCGDLLLTGSTICYLLRHSHQCALSRGPAATILSRLRRLTLQSAAPAALCVLIHFSGNMGMNATSWTPALAMINVIANMVLPQLYAWSAMWTLNSR